MRFGVLADGGQLVAWQVRCVQDLVDQAGGCFEVFISTTRQNADAQASCGPSVMGWVRRLAVRCTPYYWFSMFYAARKIDALRVVDWRKEFADVEELTCRVEPTDSPKPGLSMPECVQLRERGLSFILNFSEKELADDLLGVPQAGVWVFRHTHEGKYDGRLPGFWEIHDGDKLIKCELVRLASSHSGPVLLHSGTFRLVEDSYSATVSRVLNGCIAWPRLAWNACVRNAEGLCPDPAITQNTSAKVRPSGRQLLVFILRLLTARIRAKFEWLFLREQWCVGYINQPIHTLLGSTTVKDVRWLLNREVDRYFADPFGISDGNEITILAEEYPKASRRGRISSFTVRDDVVTRGPEVVLSLGGHLSYPFLFQYEGETYCIPECSELGEVALYRATGFPRAWNKVKTLIHGVPLLDPTIFKYDGRWWMFACGIELGGCTNLYIWHAIDPLSDWIPHCGNPVKSDVGTSRPAGTPFFHDGQLYRPAQDCSVTYGGGVVLNHITRLSEHEFEEEVVTRLKPENPGLFAEGLHTLAALGNRTLVDGKTYIFSIGRCWEVLRAKIWRIVSYVRPLC